MDRIFITGPTGFVGGNLIPYLKKFKFDIAKLNRLDLQGDIDFNNATTFIHLAGKAHDLKKVSDPTEYYQVNFELTKKLYDTFLKSDANKFIFISSVKAVADIVEGVLTEDKETNPLTDYGKSKLMAEEYIQAQILPEGKSYYILRPCMIHGPGNKGNLNLLFKVIQKGIPYPLGAFHNLRSFLSIDNLNFIIQRIISDPLIPSGIYNLADDEPLSTNQIIEIISNVNGKRSRVWHINQSIIKAIATVGDKLYLPLNSERLKKLTESFVVSNDKIKKVLNIKNLPTSSKDGLSKTIESFHSI